MKAPQPTARPVEHERHGIRWVDEFDWLRADNWQACIDEPGLLPGEIRDYLESENAWCDANLKDTEAVQAMLLKEMRGRIQADDDSLPDNEGPWSYIERYQGDDEHSSYWRYPRSGAECEGADTEQLLIDFNIESAGHDYFAPGEVEYSPDHAWLAWSVDTNGAERHTVTLRNLTRGVDEDVIHDVESIAWGDARHLFYTRVDADHRPSRVLRHELGTDPQTDIVVYEERDPRFFCSLWTSLSGDYVFISADMNDQSEVWYIPVGNIRAMPILIEARTDGLEYSIEHQGDRFLVLTNADGARDFKIMQTPCAAPDREHWRDWLPAQPGRMVLDVHAYRDWIMWMERENALPRICYAPVTDELSMVEPGAVKRIAFDEEAYALSLEPLLEFDECRIRVGYESPSTPEQTWCFDMQSGERWLLRQEIIPSGHDSDRYVVRRLQAPSLDGELVPITLLYHRDTSLDGTAPCWLTGYGAYGSSSPATFSSTILCLVDRGFVFALAHVRGGQEKGRAWYEAARFAHKHRSFDDLIGAGRYLVEQSYTSEGSIILSGASAGGLLTGAVLNREETLWAGAVVDVPFVDVLHTLLDDTLPLTPGEWSQWGNPQEERQAFDAIRSYCPYQNVQARAYPPMLVTAGISDSRVTYWEPAKWVARHRQLRSDDRLLLLKTHLASGHFGESGRYAALADVAREQAFALKVLGMIID